MDSEKTRDRTMKVVGIGYSAGGLEAATALLHNVDCPTGLAFMVAMHLAETDGSLLREVLARETGLTVEVGKEGHPIRPDHLYLAPPGKRMRYEGGCIRLETAGGRHDEIDTLFWSLAEGLGPHAIGVLLSGTLADGVAGLRALQAAGGYSIVQDPATARFPELPRAACDANVADVVLHPDRMADEITEVAKNMDLAGPAQGALEDIVETMGAATGVDFGRYKRSTLRRRSERRAAATQSSDLVAYAARLRKDPVEVEALYKDFLINVTAFFRDPEFFESLAKGVIGPLVAESKGRPIRVWVPGCATGEEVYSIAMLLLEEMEATGVEASVQVFGTDLSHPAIQHARAGIYAELAMSNISPERRSRFFESVGHGHRVAKHVRDLCLFAVHDLTRDPPFSNIDLASCRNVLIYMERELQHQVFRTLHYAVRDGGYLALGPSEGAGEAGGLFERFLEGSIYKRRGVARSVMVHSPAPRRPASVAAPHDVRPDGIAALAITMDNRIPWAHGDLRDVLARGKPDRALASGDLTAVAEEAVTEARRTGIVARRRLEGGSLAVHPIGEAGFLVIRDTGMTNQDPERGAPLRRAWRRLFQGPRRSSEVEALRGYLQHVVDDYEATTEELRSANEEALSSNEELQSTNEELETAREELQSTNEELGTLNDEMRMRNDEILAVRDDVVNLLDSLQLPVVAVGEDLRIRRFTHSASEALNLIATDVGRPITDINTGLDGKELTDRIERVISSMQAERSVIKLHDEDYQLLVSPLRTEGDRVEGAVVILMPVPA